MEFDTTKWSLILNAQTEDVEECREALAELCSIYWPPIYNYVRRKGNDPDTARDLTQEFFAFFLDSHRIQAADQSRGRFRSFLLACVSNFLTNEYWKRRAKKRHPGNAILSLDLDGAEVRYLDAQSQYLTPERAFDRQWALEVMNAALKRLEQAETQNGRSRDSFAVLEPYLAPAHEAVPYEEIADRLGISHGAAKTRLHRMRRKYGSHIRALIRDTVEDDSTAEAELRYLIELFSE